VPTHGLTLGIQNVLEARQVLLLISGPRKAAAKAALARGVENPAWPVTSLLRHPNATVIELDDR
jgi:glucosamine-6-phosphate deaminase